MNDKHAPETSEAYIIDIVNRYRQELFRYCMMLTKSPWEADDLVQETLTKLFALGLKKPLSIQKAYLFRTATNAWIDICRKKKAYIEEPLDEFTSAAQDADPLELQDSMQYMLHLLPVGQVVVVLLIDVFHFTSKETAEMLSSTEGAVKAMLHRARAALRRQAQLGGGSGSPWREKHAPFKNGRSSPQEPPEYWMARFVAAFRREDPLEIARLYMSLQQNEVEIGHTPAGNGLYFRFRDPSGGWCVVESEQLF